MPDHQNRTFHIAFSNLITRNVFQLNAQLWKSSWKIVAITKLKKGRFSQKLINHEIVSFFPIQSNEIERFLLLSSHNVLIASGKFWPALFNRFMAKVKKVANVSRQKFSIFSFCNSLFQLNNLFLQRWNTETHLNMSKSSNRFF